MKKNDTKSFTVLNNEIDTIREAMIEKSRTKGLNDPETIKYSQKLDELIFKYQRLRKRLQFNAYSSLSK